MARRSMKEEILGAGVDLFREKGFNAAGVKDITDRAGVPKGSFYNHFESKEALATVALDRYGDSLRLGDLADPAVPPVERIRRHFEFLRDGLPDFARGCLFGNFSAEIVDHSETLRMRVKGGFHQWSALLGDVIAAGQAAGEIRASLDPQQTARYLMSAWEGTLLQARADKTADAFDIFFAVTFDALLA
ncbi:TetR/AcrR family transcriptional regulator [Kribbella sp. NBC_00359]|uniref:TetR/AcrR family transcriptional regulator n=1 Tax=Kribbella sp. NBC_00359 TaxID=2975966 RepID=UPI002E2084B1